MAARKAAGESLIWSRWSFERLNAGPPDADNVKHRRLKNRDSMRRSRQRRKEMVQSLRDQVKELEEYYEQLVQTENTSNEDDERANTLEELKRLGSENLSLSTSLQQYQAIWQKLDVVRCSVATRESEKSAKEIIRNLDLEEAQVMFGFQRMKEKDVYAIAIKSERNLRNVQRRLLAPDPLIKSTSIYNNPSMGNRRYTIFGWNVSETMDTSNEVRYVYRKRFHGVSPFNLMTKTWNTCSNLTDFNRVRSETERLDILQQVSPDIYIAGCDIRHADSPSTFRSLIVVYRFDRPSCTSQMSHSFNDELAVINGRPNSPGYVIGCQSINPIRHEAENNTDDSCIVWADVTMLHEFISVQEDGSAVDSTTAEDDKYCEVRFTACTNYKSPKNARRNSIDTMSLILRWEELHIGPVIQIC